MSFLLFLIRLLFAATANQGNYTMHERILIKIRLLALSFLCYCSNIEGQVITTIAGNGTFGYSGDGGPAVDAQLDQLYYTYPAFDKAGNMYISQGYKHTIRKIDPSGTITTIAGTIGSRGHTGDGGPATNAQLNNPTAMAIDNANNIYFVESIGTFIRKIDPSGVITTLCGQFATTCGVGEGGPLANAQFKAISAITIDQAGNLYISDFGCNTIRRVDAVTGIITTIAGNGTLGYSGDGGPATDAQLAYPGQVAVDNAGNVYIADIQNHRIRKVDVSTGIITTVAGNGTDGHSGDGGPATGAQLSFPGGVVIDNLGNIYIGDNGNYIRKIDLSGTITTYAGIGINDYSGDGGPATDAAIRITEGRLSLDNNGNIYFADDFKNVIRKITRDPQAVSTLSLSITVVANSTCEYNNGRLLAIATNGARPYLYSIDGGAHYQSSGYFSSLPPGMYTITAKDALGVIVTGTASIVNTFAQPNLSVSYTNPSACGVPDATITVTGSGGTWPYQYSLDGLHYQSTPTFTNIAPGWYNTYIMDANGCVKTSGGFPQIFYFCSPPGMQVELSSHCVMGGRIVKTPAQGDTRSYLYSKDGINYQSSPEFLNLPTPAVYNIYVKDAVTNNIISIDGYTLPTACPYYITTTSTNATCMTPTGTITAVQGENSVGVSPYQYSIDGINYQISPVFSGLLPGNYDVLQRDAAGSIVVSMGTVYSDCISLNAMSTNTTCGGNNGTITATVTGGNPPFQYSLDGINFQSSNIFSTLPTGNYQITVRDAASLITTANATINAGVNDLGLTTTAQPATCLLNDGGFSITATGGTPPYEYSKDGINYQLSNTFGNLPYDNYKAIVRDANGCVFSLYPIIVPFICLRATATVTNAICGNNNGKIVVNAMNGIEPYQYSINGINFQSSPNFTGLSPSSYTVTVRDADNRITTIQVIVSDNCITITPSSTSSTCGRANGAIQITAADGTAPYSYSLNGGTFQNSNSFTDLLAGSYSITVKDANGLISNNSVVVNDIPGPQALATATAASCINNNGSIIASGIGGTVPLQYSINTTFQNSTSFSNLSSGNYTISVKDANGCTSTYPIVVPLNNDLTLTPDNDPTICEGSGATLSITSNGDSYLWTPSALLNNPTAKSPSASPSITTQYTVTAKRGVCSQTASMTVKVNPAPVADAGQGSVICFGQSSQLSGRGGETYLWSPVTYLSDPVSANPAVLKPSTSTTYSLKVKDANNCQSLKPASVTVTVTPPAKLFVGNDTSVASNQPFPLRAIDINGSGFTQYIWSPDYGLNNPHIPNPLATLDKDITYQVTASTDAGCEGTDQIAIRVYKGPDIYVPNSFTPNGDGRNDILRPIPIGIKEFRYFVLYNRWGQQVFRSSTPDHGWDGKLNGVTQNTSQFVWMAEGVDDKGNIIKRKGMAVLIK